MNHDLEQLFPLLEPQSYEITSPAQSDYNCIAWAAGDQSCWWEPDGFGIYHWPDGALRQYTIDSYAEVFKLLGFQPCGDSALEAGWEKVALFAGDDGIPTHAARQLSDGTWTSKLGKLEDINHRDLNQISGAAYGRPVLTLRRRMART